jgi:hypothetical protein
MEATRKTRQKCDTFLEEKQISRGCCPQTPLCTQCNANTATRANNITHTQHSPTFCFLCIQGVTGLHSQQSRATMPMDPLHQEKFSVLTDFVNESATFLKVSTFINNTFFSSNMSLTKCLNINMLCL